MPRVTVLQLDTQFPRIAGDIGCAETFTQRPQILKIPGASVAGIVTDAPHTIDISPFRAALSRATGDIITTSCGFLSYWQSALAAETEKPFIASALTALPNLAKLYTPDELLIITFDADKLSPAHLQGCPEFATALHGLPKQTHLRDVIENNRTTLDAAKAEAEVIALVTSARTPKTRAILLECTNLPPYKTALSTAFGLPIHDILTSLETACPKTIHPNHLCPPFPRG